MTEHTKRTFVPRSPWLTMWFHPGTTIRQIVTTNPRQGVLAITLGAGMISALRQYLTSPWSLLPHWLLNLSAMVGLYALISLTLLFTVAGLLELIGIVLGGEASAIEVRAALAWANLAWLPCVLVYVPLVLAKGISLSTGQPMGAFWVTLIKTAAWIGVPLGIWSQVLGIAALAEVQDFSIKRTLVNCLLTALCLWIIAMIAVSLFGQAAKLASAALAA